MVELGQVFRVCGQADVEDLVFADHKLGYLHALAFLVGREELEYFADALGRPSVGLGGVSPRWLRLSVEATEEIVSNAARASQPILILSAGEESLVSNDQQTAFCTTAPNCQRVEISGALHELYIESDEYRNQALTCVDEFLKALTVSGTQTSRCIDPEALGL